MPNIDLSILNQRQTPAFFADTLANRPAPSFVGRIFISTDTLDLYRDTGSAWLLLSPSSTGTITGSGAAGQVTIFSGASSITGTNNLFWDTSNLRLGINTNTPGAAIDLHSTASTLMQLNQTTATNDTRIAFQNSGTALWRIGNFYNAGANDWGIFDVVGAAQPFTIKKTTGQTFIGAETTSSGRLVVNNATGDNHIVVIGANSPSIRVRNNGSTPFYQFGLGLSTAPNNFIQGSFIGDFCIFNNSLIGTQQILFGIYNGGTGNTEEAVRIAQSKNFLIGTSVDGGQKLQISGGARATGYYLDGMTAGSGALYWTSNRVTLANYNASGTLLFEVNGGAGALSIDANRISTFISTGGNGLRVYGGSGTNQWDMYLNGANLRFGDNTGGGLFVVDTAATFSSSVGINGVSASYPLYVRTGTNQRARFVDNGGIFQFGILNDAESAYVDLSIGNSALIVKATNNVLIGTTTDAGYRLSVNGSGYIKSVLAIDNNGVDTGTTEYLRFERNSQGSANYFNSIYSGTGSGSNLMQFRLSNTSGTQNTIMTLNGNGRINMANIPTSSAGLSAGDIWNNGGVLNIV